MTKVRILFFVLMVVVVGTIAYLASLYARGYRWSGTSLNFSPSGLLVINSEPKGAQVYIGGILKTATDATINLPPGEYQVEIKKDGFLTWNKTLTIQKEIVTEADVFLFPTLASLSPITFSGVQNPVASSDFSKIAYADKKGLWVNETVNLPLGFNREQRQVTDGDLTDATWEFSPDGRQILLTTKTGSFLLDASKMTPQTERVNVTQTLTKTRADWATKKKQILDAQLQTLPAVLADILGKKGTNISFSPDENKVLYEASESATIPEKLVKELPGSSTQKESRELKKGYKYVYDTKEDRNFEVAEPGQIAYWFPNGLNLILPQKDKIVIEDYDGTNKQTVYSGSYTAPFAFPFSNTTRIIILTNLGSNGDLPNLYSLSLR